MSNKSTHKNLEQKIRKLERENKGYRDLIRNFKSLYSSMVEGVCLHEIVCGQDGEALDYRILDVNPAYEKITKINKDKAVGQLASDLYGSGKAPYLDIYANVTQTGEPKTFETYFPPLNKHFTISAIPLEKDKFATIFFDITTFKEAEKALRESDAMLQTIYRAAPIGIGLVTNRIFGWVNDTLSNLIGYSRDELEGKGARMIYPSDEEFERVARTKHPQVLKYGSGSIETQFKHKNGQVIDVLLSSSTLVPGDLSAGLIFTVMDITERKRAERALKKSEENYRELVENINDAIYETDAEGKLVYVSPVIEAFTGYKHSEIIDQNFTKFIYPDDLPVIIERFKEILDGVIRPSEYRIVTKSGQIKWVRSSSRPVYSEKGLTAIRGILTDINDSKKAEEEKKKLQDQLRQAQKMESIGTLAGGIAHDFNNILSAVIGYTELALTDAERNTQLYINLQEVLRAGGRAKDLVKQVLTFSRQAEQERKPVPVKLIGKEALKFLRASLPTTIEIRQYILSDSLVMADPTQIYQVLMNLCTNASHAMRERGGVLKVKLLDVELDDEFTNDQPELKPGAYLELTVSDTGHGIPAHLLERIFDPFFTTKEKGEGTGMGLAVVHGIVGSCGGAILAFSEPGVGSTFKVYLPAVEKRIEPRAKLEKPIPTGSERILFVDDERTLVNIGKHSLESLGYEVTIRTSSIEALELFRAKPERFDLVITDMTMPNMAGDDLARELIRINPETPIILCTGYSARINQQQAMAMGIRAFVSKPLLKREIAETIRQVLDTKLGVF